MDRYGMDKIAIAVAQLVEDSKDGSMSWEFDENASMARQYASECVQGRIIACIEENFGDRALSDRVIGLLTAFSARRSLVAWCIYCDSVQPITVVDNVISFWLHHTPLQSTAVEEPSENGVPIIDCRWGDTHSAASAVKNAAEFVVVRDWYVATLSLVCAFLGFALSPAGSVDTYVKWLVEFALPCAIELRQMTVEEQFALADYDIPEVLR